MPNDAKLGLFVGVAVVVALAIVYRGKNTDAPPEAAMQAPKRLATVNQLETSRSPGRGDAPLKWPSLPVGNEVEVENLGRKEDAPKRVDRQPDTADQEHEEKDRA